MKNFIQKLSQFKVNESNSVDPFCEFAQSRYNGAEKISKNAKEKGGNSLLTYHHFVVKLPYYKKAATGKFNTNEAKGELAELHRELKDLIKTFEPKDQTPFQKVMGKIEVLGELLIARTKFK